jgi:hypothetical protein
MKRLLMISFGVLAAATCVFAQQAEIDHALAAAPAQMKDATTVIKFKADGSYDTLKKGTNKLVCYDRSGEPGRAPFAVQCSVLGNIPRIAQNRKFEAEQDKAKRQAMIDEAEKSGTRVKPEFGSVWYDMNGPDQEHARIHTTIAVPGATSASTGMPDTPAAGGAWIMNAGTSTAHIMTPGH